MHDRLLIYASRQTASTLTFSKRVANRWSRYAVPLTLGPSLAPAITRSCRRPLHSGTQLQAALLTASAGYQAADAISDHNVETRQASGHLRGYNTATLAVSVHSFLTSPNWVTHHSCL